MYGIIENKFNKTEKNKKIKEGPCIFPFKYKWKEHNTCVDTPKGEICATEINPKSRTLTKYGYCKKKNDLKKSTKKKTPETPKKLKKKLKLVEKFTKTLKQAEKTKSPSKEKTLKNKKPKKLKKLTLKVISPQKDKKMPSSHKSKRWNEDFMKVLQELQDVLTRTGEFHRGRAYQRAQETLMLIPEDITNLSQLKNKPYIGKTILAKFKEYMETGTLAVLERERKNPMIVLTRVYGIGAQQAKKFIADGITTLADLRKKFKEDPSYFNKNQRIGIEYYDDIEKRIPRKEIDEYKKVLTPIFEKTTPKGSKFDIVGSYRRGKGESGDIDMIITNEDNNKKAFTNFIEALTKDKIILEFLTKGPIKRLTIGQLPGKTPRRLDFLYSPSDEYAFALLYFTGSKFFNTVMRQRALDRGYTLNEHGFSTMVDGKKGKKLEQHFPDEKSIFNFLGMKYKEPAERLDGRSVEDIEKTPKEESKEKTPKKKEENPPKKKEDNPPKKKEEKTPKKKTLKEKEKKEKKEETPKRRTSPRNKTLKKKTINAKELIKKFKKEGANLLAHLSEDELSAIIRAANDAYYCNKEPLMTDNQYDLVRDYTTDKFPYNAAVQEGHTQCAMEVEKNKVQLPYEMWSMDKIKPDTGALTKWKKKYKGPYVLSCKLDGVSGLYSTENGEQKLYTRGNGTVGQDVSHLIPYLKLPKTPDITIRGEFVMAKETFKKKFAGTFANTRNLVAGIVNSKKLEPKKLHELAFVAYEVIKPELKPSAQMKFLSDEKDIEVVKHETRKKITNESLSDVLVKWRAEYEYDIDGVIVIDDKLFPRKRGNPEHAFAFKMVLSDQIVEAKVIDIAWNPSKDGYLKPTIKIEPVVVPGATLNHVTGFNAKYIEDNKIGIGTLIKLIRSGDVIPHILDVIEPADEALMPSVPYKWNATKVDVMVKNISSNEMVQEKRIDRFFKVIKVDGLGDGNIHKIIEHGYKTLKEILDMTKEDLLQIEGFKEKTATKIYEGIKKKIAEASLVEIMSATNIFGRGFGEKTVESILKAYPDILTSSHSSEEKIELAVGISGIGEKTAQLFVSKIPSFLKFLDQTGLKYKIKEEQKKSSQSYDKSDPLFEKKIVFTGVRDEEIGKIN